MNIKIKESIKYLLLEYKRLKKKKENHTINKNEIETLNKLNNFINKKK